VIPRVGVSACLLGLEVRYDGGHRRTEIITRFLGRHVTWVPVCPEVEIGLGVPRETIQLVEGPAGTRLIGTSSGTDLTTAMNEYARRRTMELRELGISGYILKARSPSCGLAVPVHGRHEADEPSGDNYQAGLFAAALLEHFPELPIEQEASLIRWDECRRFLRRVRRYQSRYAAAIPGA
jgi:uncharacterized protein YbbK (DUF523 family)